MWPIERIKELIHRSAWRNCLENSRRLLDHTSSATRGGRSRLLKPLLVAFVAPMRDPFRFSKQFRKGYSQKSISRILHSRSPYGPENSYDAALGRGRSLHV